MKKLAIVGVSIVIANGVIAYFGQQQAEYGVIGIDWKFLFVVTLAVGIPCVLATLAGLRMGIFK